MSTEREIDIAYKTSYQMLVDTIGVQNLSPEHFAVVVDIAKKYRDKLAYVTGIQGLPEVPDK